ncbi:MAG: hypothetical protein WC553_03170 [Patescibacteria group bacterium]
MNVYKAKAGRFLLYLDILGFKQLIRHRSPEEVYATVDQMLRETAERERGIPDFTTLYFSDTIVFFQKSVGYGSWAFGDIYSLTAMIWSALAARKIPTRGAIAFGDFHAEPDSRGQHTVFFGEALIEAYETEKLENWIGVTLCPSAVEIVNYVEPNRLTQMLNEPGAFDYVDQIEKEHAAYTPAVFVEYFKKAQPTVLHRTACRRVLLNPLYFLHQTWFADVYDEGVVSYPLHHDSVHFAHDILSLKFILQTAEEPDGADPERNKVLAKYRNTAALLRQMFPSECIEWALKLYETFPDQADEGWGDWKK